MNLAARTYPVSEDQPVLYFVDAQCKLWQGLQDGALKARGIRPGADARTWIPREEWKEIGYSDPPAGRPDAVGVMGEDKPRFYDVAVDREKVISIWRAPDDKAEIEPKSKRGRKKKIDPTFIRETVFALMNERGEFDDDASDWKVQADLERAVAKNIEKYEGTAKRVPGESTLRRNIAKPLSEWRKLEGPK